jgi:hypothetical protein
MSVMKRLKTEGVEVAYLDQGKEAARHHRPLQLGLAQEWLPLIEACARLARCSHGHRLWASGA